MRPPGIGIEATDYCIVGGYIQPKFAHHTVVYARMYFRAVSETIAVNHNTNA